VHHAHVSFEDHRAELLGSVAEVAVLAMWVYEPSVEAAESYQSGPAVGNVAREKVADAIAANAVFIKRVEGRGLYETDDPDCLGVLGEAIDGRLEPAWLRDSVIVGEQH
jgi:hypothetical protein